MTEFDDPRFYGERWAPVYDPMHPELDPESVAFLAKLAGQDGALEFGIGTGRLALPLAEAGVRVHGIDISEPMLDQLRAKPGAESIGLTVGDMTQVSLPDKFGVVYMAFNGIYCALTQEDQIGCFRNAANHLTADGAFVLECYVPDVARFDRGQRVQVLEIGEDVMYVEYTMHDPVEQRVRTHLVAFSDGRAQLGPMTLRYAWPTELDLMARLAGLRLEHRYGDWDRRAYGNGCTKHVSVYRFDTGR